MQPIGIVQISPIEIINRDSLTSSHHRCPDCIDTRTAMCEIISIHHIQFRMHISVHHRVLPLVKHNRVPAIIIHCGPRIPRLIVLRQPHMARSITLVPIVFRRMPQCMHLLHRHSQRSVFRVLVPRLHRIDTKLPIIAPLVVITLPSSINQIEMLGALRRLMMDHSRIINQHIFGRVQHVNPFSNTHTNFLTCLGG